MSAGLLTEPASIEAEAHRKADAKHGGKTTADLRADSNACRRDRKRERVAKRAATPAAQGRRSGIQAALNAQAIRERQQRPRTRHQRTYAERKAAARQGQMRTMRRILATAAIVFGGLPDYAFVVRLAMGVRGLEARASTAVKLRFGAALGRQGKPPAGTGGRRTNSGGFKEAQRRLDARGFITRKQNWHPVNPHSKGDASEHPQTGGLDGGSGLG